MSTPIKGGLTGNLADVDASNNLKVVTPTDSSAAGYVALVSRQPPGAAGTARVKALDSTMAGSLDGAATTMLWEDTFAASTHNTSYYRYANSTQTMTQSNGFLVTNSTGSTVSSTLCALQTHRTFTFNGREDLNVVIDAMIPSAFAHVAGTTIEAGLFTAVLTAQAVPTDGVFWRWDAVGDLRGVVNYNGTEAQTAVITKPSEDVVHQYRMTISQEQVEFWIDNELRGTIARAAISGVGRLCAQSSLPFTIKQRQAVSPASATKLQIASVCITHSGASEVRRWEVSRAGSTLSAYQGLNGGTAGSTSTLSNAALSAAAALTNTGAAGPNTGLGGAVHVLPTLTAGTDGIVFSYQNPVGSVTQPPRTLVIEGVTIGAAVTAALTGGPVVYLYSLAYGHTAISLATTESGSFVTGTTKAPRRIALGFQSIAATAAVGAVGEPINVKFNVPVVVAPGEFVAIAARNLGTVTSAGTITISALFDAFYE